jgi:hypothetical protein
MASVGALPMTELQLPGAPEAIEPSEQLEADCQDQVETLAQEILNRGAAARAAVVVSAVQGAQRPEGRRVLGQVGEQRSQAPFPRLQRPPGQRWHPQPQRDRRSLEGRRGSL